MRLIRFVVGMSVVAVSIVGSAVAHSPVRTPVIRQAALTNPRSFSEDFRLSDRQQLNDYFLAGSHDRLR
jgi:hypothetical protein